MDLVRSDVINTAGGRLSMPVKQAWLLGMLGCRQFPAMNGGTEIGVYRPQTAASRHHFACPRTII